MVMSQCRSSPAILCVLVKVQVKAYISIALAIVAPFDCYEYPNGDEAVQEYPAILCILVGVQVKLYISIVLDIFAHFDAMSIQMVMSQCRRTLRNTATVGGFSGFSSRSWPSTGS